jgi:hypothetical protein
MEENVLHRLEIQGMAGAWHVQWYTHIGLLTIKGASAVRRVTTTNGGKEANNGWSQYGPRTVTVDSLGTK